MHVDRVYALLNDPAPGAAELTDEVRLLPLTTPGELSVDETQRLRDALDAVRKLQLPSTLHTPEVDPLDHPTQATYTAALQHHYDSMVNQQIMRNDRLQAQYDLVHFDPQHRRIHLADFIGQLKLPCVTHVYVHRDLSGLSVDGPLAMDMLKRRHGQPIRDQFMAQSRRYSVTVRRDLPDRRSNNRGTERPPRPEDLMTVQVWTMAYWLTDPWHDVYPLWKAHGGRAALLTFPAS